MLGGDWRFLDEGAGRSGGKGNKGAGKKVVGSGGGGEGDGQAGISEPVREVVRRCLRVEAAERPDVDELITMIGDVVAGLPPDDEDDAGEED